jgi:hypothetical protein
MQIKNSIILPIAGLVLPLGFYLIIASFIAPVFTALQISNDILLATLAFAYLIVVLHANLDAKSQNKFFKKYLIKLEKNDLHSENSGTLSLDFKRGTFFFLNILGDLIAIALWVFFFPDEFSESIGISNIWHQLVVLIIIMFLVSNAFKVISTSLMYKVTIMTSLNSMKFIIVSDIFWYGLIVAYFLFISGFFF